MRVILRAMKNANIPTTDAVTKVTVGSPESFINSGILGIFGGNIPPQYAQPYDSTMNRVITANRNPNPIDLPVEDLNPDR